jgi:hypothetical protein
MWGNAGLISPLLGSNIQPISIGFRRNNPMSFKPAILATLKSIVLAGFCAALLAACVPPPPPFVDAPSQANPNGKGPEAN